MFFTPNFGFISRKITVQPVKRHSNTLDWCVLGRNFCKERGTSRRWSSKRSVQRITVSFILHLRLGEEWRNVFQTAQISSQIEAQQIFLLLITKNRIGLSFKYLMFFIILTPEIYFIYVLFSLPLVDTLCLKKCQCRLDSYFSYYSAWYFSSS